MWVSIGTIYLLSMVFFVYSMVYTNRRERTLIANQALLSEKDTDHVATRCSQLSLAFELSPREKDVLELIAQGRDASYVAAKLFISENTVRSHVKSIYNKIGIHSRQELFSLVNDKGSE